MVPQREAEKQPFFRDDSLGATLAVVRSEPAGENVQQDGDGAGHQRGDDDAEADDEHIDLQPVGQPCAHAHDLGAAAIDDEATVHWSLLVDVAVQAIGSEVAAETNTSEVNSAAARLTAS